MWWALQRNRCCRCCHQVPQLRRQHALRNGAVMASSSSGARGDGDGAVLLLLPNAYGLAAPVTKHSRLHHYKARVPRPWLLGPAVLVTVKAQTH